MRLCIDCQFAKCALLTVLFLTALSAGETHAQDATLRGFVTEAESGQPLPGVNVVVVGADSTVQGASTNLDGFYTLPSLSSGRYAVRVSFVGYQTVQDTLTLEGETKQYDVEMSPSSEELGVATVETERTTGAANVTAGQQRIRAEDVKLIPAPDVSGDLVNYLTSLPGIVATGDRGGQLYIRGGEPTQNLVLLDGMPVYQPFHVLGFYSAFPNDLLSTADVYAGGYDARFGGQLSSVLDVSSRNGNLRRFAGSASVAPFVSSLSVEGPILKDKVSFLASGRRSVVDQVADRLVDEPLPFDFGDAFGKLHYTPTPTSRLSATALYTFDRGTVGAPQTERPDEVRYRNAAAGFRYILLPSTAPLLGEVALSYSTLNTELGPTNPEVNDPDDRLTRSAFLSRFNAEFNLTYFLRNVEARFGGFIRTANTETQLGGLFQNVEFENDYITEAGLYAQPEIEWGGLRVSPGVRVTTSPNLGQSFVEPRFRAVFEGGPHRLSAAAGLYNQPLVGISDRRDATSIFTAWTSAPDGQTPEALHVLGGYRLKVSDRLDVSVEGFYKDLQNLSIAEWTAIPRLTTRLQQAEGTAHGMDLRLEVRPGPAYFSATYGLSSVEYEASQARYDLWYGSETLRFRPGHDRRHQVTLIASTPLAGFDLSARWQFGSGLPYSQALGFDTYILPSSSPDVATEPGEPRVIYERPFNSLLPDYHRLDLSVERLFHLGPAQLTAQVGAINAYDRRNLFAYDIFTLDRVDQLPLIPTFGLKLETP